MRAQFPLPASAATRAVAAHVVLTRPHLCCVVQELASNWDDRIIASVLGRCRVVPKTNGRLYTRMTSLKVTDIGHNVTAQQWEDESNRARFLRRRFGKFLLERCVASL